MDEAELSGPSPDRGLVHVYYGDGKGKTTAAVGLAVRALGAGLDVRFAQFLKSGVSAELDELRSLGAQVISGAQEKFVFQMTDDERCAARENNEAVFVEALMTPCDVLVLDEAIGACQLGLISRERLENLLRNKPFGLELILTGRDPEPFVLAHADYATEMVCRKHPFECGIAARRGIEF